MTKSKTDFGLNWLIRDARGLTVNEKLFLYTIASHQDGMRKTHDKNHADMGFSRATYYRVRTSLIAKGTITETRRMNAPTVYVIDKPALQAWAESHVENESAQRGTPQSHTETPSSQRETAQSPGDNTKGNLKGNMKENSKGNKKSSLRDVASPDAGAPVSPTSVPEPSLPLAESPSYSRTAAGLIEEGMSRAKVKTKAKSHSETVRKVGLAAGRVDWDDIDW
jgi:hypothetical protein